MDAGHKARRLVADLPLAWKLLLPSLVFMLVLSVVGTFVVVRYLTTQARDEVDARLGRTALRIEAATTEQLSYLVEAARVNAHLDGIESALQRGDREALAGLDLQTLVVRGRTDLSVTTDASGLGLVELRRSGEVQRSAGTQWARDDVVAKALQGPADLMRAAVIDDGGLPTLIVAAPIQVDNRVLGLSIVGIRLHNLVEMIQAQVGAEVAFYNRAGRILSASASRVPPVVRVTGDTARRRDYSVDGRSFAAIFQPLDIQGQNSGVVATWTSDSGGPSLWGLGARVGAIFLFALLAVIGITLLIARVVLRQVRALVATHADLARGDLAARVEVAGDDELGVVANGLNDMAEQLQASHTELESRVAARTEELQRLYDESVKAAEARGEFFAAISHELRTPLFVILGHAELMADKELQPAYEGWTQEYGSAIAEAAQDLLHRVNEILELSKLQQGKLRLDLAEVSLRDVVAGSVEELAPLARRGQLSLTWTVADDVPPVRADVLRMRDVLRNLLSNAIKFTPPGGSIAVTAARRRGLVEVSIADSGVGIPAEHQAHLFEPFYQVPGIRPQGQQPSTGLGLAVAARLVDAHGGTIRVVSAPGQGSTFSFTLRTSRRHRNRVRNGPSTKVAASN